MTISDGPEVQRPGLRRNAIANIAGRLASAVVWVAVTPYALAKLGPERFGIWSLFFAMSGYVAAFDFGMSAATSRYVAVMAARNQRHEARNVILRTLVFSGGLGLLWGLACVLGRGLFLRLFKVPAVLESEVMASLSMFGLSLLLFSIGQVLQGALFGFRRLDLSNAYFLIGLMANVAVLIIGLSQGLGLMAAALAATTGQVVSGLLSAHTVRRELRRLEPRTVAAPVPWRELFGYGGIVQVNTALTAAQLQIGKVLVGVLGRLAWVTQFELGFRVATALAAVPGTIQMSIIPAAAHAAETGGERQVREIYEWCCRWVFALSGWVIGGLWLLAPVIFRLWLGGEQAEAVAVARWVAVAWVLVSLSGPAMAIARGRGWPHLETINLGLALAFNIVLCWWLVPRLGALGAAMAMAGSHAVPCTVYLFVFHHRMKILNAEWLGRLALPRILPSVVVVAVLTLAASRWVIDSRAEAFAALLLQGAAFTALYVTWLWHTGDPQAVWARIRAVIFRRSGETVDRGVV